MSNKMSDSLSRNRIESKYPWAFKEGKNMIIGADIDAIMSSVYLSENLDWNLIGIYTDFENLYTKSGVCEADVLDAIWIDLDIYNPNIASIGHHILNFKCDNNIPGHSNTLNPNLLRGVSHENFTKKYPLGTIHFLSWLHDEPTTATDIQQLLYWVPDSAWINGQPHRFRENVGDWLKNCIPTEFIIDSFDWIKERSFEESLEEKIYTKIENTGFDRGRGQVLSKHKNLGGFQCTFTDPNKHNHKLQSLVDLIGNIMDWEPFKIPRNMEFIQANRTYNYPYNKILSEFSGFDEFLSEYDVFSYAIPNRNTLNYTTRMNLSDV